MHFGKIHPQDPGYTFPTHDPHLRVDYVFVPRPFANRVTSCEIGRREDAANASDHFPLVAELLV